MTKTTKAVEHLNHMWYFGWGVAVALALYLVQLAKFQGLWSADRLRFVETTALLAVTVGLFVLYTIRSTPAQSWTCSRNTWIPRRH